MSEGKVSPNLYGVTDYYDYLNRKRKNKAQPSLVLPLYYGLTSGVQSVILWVEYKM